jgi:Dolichyl-phosphate-mannose-protein mannosyltransferase
MIKAQNPRLWLLFGAIAGLALENKYSIAVFAFALLVGLLLTQQRKLLFTPWLLAGGAVAALIFLPNFWWNVQHHWPFLELMRNIRESGRDVVLSPAAFVGQQILIMTPLSLPFWLGGLLYYLFSRDAKPYRAFGLAFLVTIAFFLLAHGKNYYSAPAYPIVLAAGAVLAERLLSGLRMATHPRLRIVLEAGAFVWLILAVAPILPVVIPLLPVDAYLRYQAHLPFEVPRSEHGHEGAALPQHYADEFGWPEMVAAVARVYASVPEADRAKTAIYTQNYGQAGAIDFFGPQYGLPKAICAHQTYSLWGPRNYHGEIMILVGSRRIEDARQFFDSVEPAATLDNPSALFYEKRTILLARGLKTDLQTLWPQLKHWD